MVKFIFFLLSMFSIYFETRYVRQAKWLMPLKYLLSVSKTHLNPSVKEEGIQIKSLVGNV